MIGWVRRWPLLLAVVVAAAVVVAMTPSTTTASTAAFAYDIPSIARNDAHGIGTDGAGPAQFSGWRAEPAPPSAHGRGTSTTPSGAVVATNTVDDVFRAPGTSINRHGQLTNGTYTIDAVGMAPHKAGSLAGGKSQWWSGVDAERPTLDAAAYADANNLWVGAKAKVPATNGTVGVLGRTGEPTEWINVYRNANGFVHGAPGGAG